MLFNSYEFIFIFSPVVMIGYFLLGRFTNNRSPQFFLLLSSLIFYGYWNLDFLPVLILSIVVNFWISGQILNNSRNFFIIGIIFNIGLLSWFKYLPPEKILPLGISFFTITQLLYLYDCYAGVSKDHDSLRYALFVSFFPHLLAGPILYHRQMMKQFRDEKLRAVNFENLSRGLTLFTIGLSKKVFIADNLSPFVAEGYSNISELTLIQAWLVAVCYALQLYFDFSGYSDMAVGLARMLNFEIPINFNSPYKSTNPINFWQRWHISLTNAMTACIYLPLMKFFKTRTLFHTVVASFITFFIVGIWHGAGLTFVGFALFTAFSVVANYLWRSMNFSMPKFLAHISLLSFTALTMVFLRADNLSTAFQMFSIMFGSNGIAFPQKFVTLMNSIGLNFFQIGNVPGNLPKLVFILAILLVAFSPSSNQIAQSFSNKISTAVLVAVILFLSILQLSSVTVFLYFQF